ncbi:MAG TPA: wax ester/triacylglycerol synthase family O-acyltransferase [Dermatophilaceae bacterium]|nr:wax ester/triacylglycerol synthase family O-acyltransferase [Dermatophilaceae bacterium]
MERLTPLSAAFLQAEDEDPTTSMAIASTAVLEGPPPPQEDFVAHLAGRVPLVPRFRQVVLPVPFDLGAPVWADAPETDLAWHCRRTALPAPGGPAELHRLVARVMSQRMDRSRPLWEYWVVEGLQGGRWAVITKLHHCVVDGVSGTSLYSVVYDAGPEPGPPTPDHWQPRPRPGRAGLLAGAARDAALTPVAVGRATLPLLRHPVGLGKRVARTARGSLALLGAVTPAAPSSLRGAMGRQRRYASTVVPLAEVREVREALGGSLNDVALAAISGGLRALLISRGEEPHARAVRSLVPVSLRQPGEESLLDNRVSLLLPFLPVDVADPVERLETVHRRIREAAASGEPSAGADLTAIYEHEPFLPIALGVRAAFHLPQLHLVTVTTNVPGPREPVWMLGRRCRSILPYVPIADRVRVGVSIFSYAGELAFGVTGDFDTAPDVDTLADGIRESVEELRAAARDRAGRTARGKASGEAGGRTCRTAAGTGGGPVRGGRRRGGG